MQDKRNDKKNDTKKDNLSHLDLDTVNASSSTDCTGLIPAATHSYAERESYQEVYDYEAGIKEENS